MPTIKSYNKRLELLKSERSSFIPVYRSLSDYHMSNRGRFLTSDRNKGYQHNQNQINNTSRMAARTMAAGMMAGITSPARPWFKLQSSNVELNEYSAVKEWLHAVQTIMYRVFSQSNAYNSLHTVYSELGVFGTAPMGVYFDYKNVIRCRPYTVGSYVIGANGKSEIDTFYLEYERTVGQLIKEYGPEKCSNSVNDQWKRGNTEAWVPIVHAIEPNDDRDSQSPWAKDKNIRSVYYETSSKGDQSLFLNESGFDEFPILCPRWDITGEDIYATSCPGMDSLGDTKSLQLGEKQKYKALDMIVNPPMQGDVGLKTQVSGNIDPGQIIWTEGPTAGIRSVYEGFRPDLNSMVAINQEAEQRIKRTFYEDLFLMMVNSDRRQITAREVAEKQEEKLLMLGPVLERLHNELLDPLIDRTFSILQKAGVLPPPPPELNGVEMSVQYVSVLAQAQRMVSIGGLERLTGFTAQLAQLWPESRHKFDAQQAIDEYADSMGVNPRIVRGDDEVNQLVAADRQQQAQAQAAAQGESLANTAKTVSETNMSEENALGQLLKNAGLM